MTAGLHRIGDWRLLALWGVIALLSGGVAAPASAIEKETHIFDPVLSLTGDCTTSTLDPVADPGCGEPSHAMPGRFNVPRSVTVDQHAIIYVATAPSSGIGGVINLFDSGGHFLTQVPDGHNPLSVAVDSDGYLYVFRGVGDAPEVREVVRYEPEEPYEPAVGAISYDPTPTVVVAGNLPFFIAVAVDSEDHLYVDLAQYVEEYKPASEGNEALGVKIGNGSLNGSKNIAVDPNSGDIYASDKETADNGSDSVIKVFDGDAPHSLLQTIDGSTAGEGAACPSGDRFHSTGGFIFPTIEKSSGNIFVYDGRSTPKAVYELDPTGSECIAKFERDFENVVNDQITIDNDPASPNQGYLYVPSGQSVSESHLWAFEPKQFVSPPVIESLSFSEVSATNADLRATINPEGGETHYMFEYTAEENFESEGFASALVAGEGDIPAGKLGVAVSTTATGLLPGTTYVVRVRAENDCNTVPEPETECAGVAQGSFRTFEIPGPPPSCPNDALRIELGSSAALPDCRAYELVSPPDTGGRPLFDTQFASTFNVFGSLTAARDGERVAFGTTGGSLPGTSGAGSSQGTPYLATRDSVAGWDLEGTGPTGTQSRTPIPGGHSDDLGYSAVKATLSGELLVEGSSTSYVRHPDGSYELVGVGSVGEDPGVGILDIAPLRTHTVFYSKVQLELEAPATGVRAIYDRTPDGVIHVISLLPEDVTPGTLAFYEGISDDGSVVAFKLGDQKTSPLYLRVDNGETLQIAGAGGTFAGISADGRYAFYVEGGNLFRLDTETEALDEIAMSNDATVVNVAASGAVVYFVSAGVLTGEEENPNGAKAQAGEGNLYRWSEDGIRFVATVTPLDVEGELSGLGGFQTGGLGLWSEALDEGATAIDPSRTNPSGSVLVFESRANLDDYDSEGMAEVYRFDAAGPTLHCLSCNPTMLPPTSNASLQSVAGSANDPQPTGRYAVVPSLTAEGNRVFFETADGILGADTNGVQDVYEWEANGIGSCDDSDGCVYLISSGQSANASYLFGVSEDGADVFISTTERLLRSDADETASIYDARVDGGFPEPEQAECEGEGCRPSLTPSPSMAAPQTAPSGPSGNVVPQKKRCPKGRHKAKRKGRTVCVRNHKKHRKHRTAGRAGK